LQSPFPDEAISEIIGSLHRNLGKGMHMVISCFYRHFEGSETIEDQLRRCAHTGVDNNQDIMSAVFQHHNPDSWPLPVLCHLWQESMVSEAEMFSAI